VVRAAASAEDLRIDAASVVTDAQPELPGIVGDFQLDVKRSSANAGPPTSTPSETIRANAPPSTPHLNSRLSASVASIER